MSNQKYLENTEQKIYANVGYCTILLVQYFEDVDFFSDEICVQLWDNEFCSQIIFY